MECQSRPSIPSRFKVQILPNSLEKKAFSSTEARFKDSNISETPGPGAYSNQKDWGVGESPSFGKRGTGYFASQSRRLPRMKKQGGPSASTYAISTNFSDRKDFSRAYSYGFQIPRTQPIKKIAEKTPAPNKYDPVKSLQNLEKSQGTTSVFKSKSKRGLKTSASSTVAPNAYNPKPLEKKSSTMNWFRDTAERFPLKNEYSDGPGPAAYSSSTNLKASKSNTTNQPCRGWNLISAPALPVDKPGPLPGPGQYDVGVYKSPVKESMGSYMFKSNSSRLTKAKIASQPGPGAYTPKEFERFSYRHPASNHFVAA
ncbi:Oidioi.mRNA.OKI2018_I69.PAR.g8524.t1.cds [Oikopleura dioica]|uniref:Oidioi.mRNA.OKI2018_I69.PAR.g8524.t1.cds n=1 Tax=Oikopleura dioica TaxID=34765 RepID=A0ABN7RGD6_OIKDI|nr:Oidioi.mRNA.OKI2018_I69.PAR.g8524.t1.cds [Oikopleura dioica]